MTITTAVKHIKIRLQVTALTQLGLVVTVTLHHIRNHHGGDMSRTHLSSPAQLQLQESLPTHFGAGLGLLTGDSLCPECSLTMTPDTTPSLTDAPSQTDNEKTH